MEASMGHFSRMAVMSLTPQAVARVNELIAGAGRPVAGLRIGVRNGGCAGMAYTMDLADSLAPGDELVEQDGARVLVDPKAILFLIGTQMDYQTGLWSSGFVFNNPNQTAACGCGESIALTPADPAILASAHQGSGA
jgi:iron-sulfur cluster assembly protein